MGMPAKKISKITGIIDPLSKVVSKITGKEMHELSDPLGLFTAPDAPELPEAPGVMPIADEEALARARKRTAARKGAGRASTVLTLGAGGGKTTVGG